MPNDCQLYTSGRAARRTARWIAEREDRRVGRRPGGSVDRWMNKALGTVESAHMSTHTQTPGTVLGACAEVQHGALAPSESTGRPCTYNSVHLCWCARMHTCTHVHHARTQMHACVYACVHMHMLTSRHRLTMAESKRTSKLVCCVRPSDDTIDSTFVNLPNPPTAHVVVSD